MRYLAYFFLLLTFPLFAQKPLIIGIAGGTGSGKTTLAEQLLEIFPSHAILINQDAYYKDLNHLSQEKITQHNFDHPDALDFSLLKEHLLALKQNQDVEIPVYNFCTHTREEKTTTLSSADLIILEGILIFAIPEIRELCDLKLFVETDDDIRLLRRIERDMQSRGREFIGIKEQYLTTVKPMHDAFVEPSKRFADLIIPTLERNDTSLLLLVAGLKKQLKLSS